MRKAKKQRSKEAEENRTAFWGCLMWLGWMILIAWVAFTM